jgi:D-alanyl-D-alanine carboxypeptidase
MPSMLRAGLSAVALMGAGFNAGFAQSDPAPDWADQADALIEAHWTAQTPGVSVLVRQNGDVVYARGAGLANLETGDAVTPDTVFRLASITKQFTAAVILQLVDEGALSLDDTIGDLFEGFDAPGASATVRQLLNHTSGIQSYTSIPGWMVEANTNRAYTTDALIAEFSELPAPNAPGETYAYNNSGYVLLGAIIEMKTGMAWHEAVEARIAEPLGLETLRYGGDSASMANMASGYTLNDDGEIEASTPIHMSVPHAAGALIANTQDLALWLEALHGGGIVSPELYQQMTAPTQMADGTEIPYGFGLSVDDVRGHPAIGHSGGIFGFNTDSVYVPDDNLYVTVLANSDQPPLDAGVLMRRIASYALNDPYPLFEAVETDLTSLEDLYGVYAIEGTDDTRQFFARDGQLYTLRSGGSASEVFPAGDNRFFYGPNSLTWFEIVSSSDGTSQMNMYQQGASEAEPALWSGPVPEQPDVIELPASTLEAYVGAYALGAAVLEIRFTETGVLEAQLTGQDPIAINAISDVEFLVSGVDARLVFSPGDPAPSVTLQQSGQEILAERVTE